MPAIILFTATIALFLWLPESHAQEAGYYSHPAIHGDRLIFASEGDLWTAHIPDDPDATILAHRLTSDDGTETRPCISPNGASIAFAGEYDGNIDVYIMPTEGGAPKRLTFHPGSDLPLGWTPDGRSVLFRSGRAHPFGRAELWKVSITGGMPDRFDFGECSLAALNPGGKLVAFTQWSNEDWSWKSYRGGTAPDIWVGEFASGRFQRLTDDPANDLFPMWLQGSIYYLSDRAGAPNIFSQNPRGGEAQQHTRFAASATDPTAIEGYDLRWPSADPSPQGSRIVFAQGGALALLQTKDDTVRRLKVMLASDRVAQRRRFIEPGRTVTEFALSPDGSHLLVGTRGDLVSYPVEPGRPVHLASNAPSRERGGAWRDEETIIAISDIDGEQQIVVLPADDSDEPRAITTDREDWLFPPVVSPGGAKVAFADKTLRLHVLDLETGRREIIDRSEAWEIIEYTFSPDSQWLAYTKPMPNGYGRIHLYSIRTGRSFPLTEGWHNEHHPAWDPKGRYLYFLADSALNPTMGTLDLEYVFVNTTQVYAVPLRETIPPPIKSIAAQSDFDLAAWAKKDGEKKKDSSALEVGPGADEQDDGPMRLDLKGIESRVYLLPVEPARYTGLGAVYGGVVLLRMPTEGLLDEVWPPRPPGRGKGTIVRFDLLKEKPDTLAEKVSAFSLSRDRSTIAYFVKDGIAVRQLVGGGEPKVVDLAAIPIRVEVAREWRQIFEEAWRLERDFYWAPNMHGIDWEVMREKYRALIPRVGTRAELNDVIGEMIGELRTSHTYVAGGERFDEKKPINVGMLGADLAYRDGALRIERILPGVVWEASLRNPLAMPHLHVTEGATIIAVNGTAVTRATNIYDLLQGHAKREIALTIRDEDDVERTIEITALADEAPLRYAAWVEANRRRVEEASAGKIGYLHIPDMGGPGLVAFSRFFFPQINKNALIVDVRDNNGGFVSQMIIERLARRIWAFQQPRHGLPATYPSRTLHGHLAVIIDQHAGSDGDIFPESFRIRDLGPLIGTRTWGGVVGIRMDKPFVDLGVSSQPEFAWWEPLRGWSLENAGVTPDIDVPITPEDRRRGTDPQLDKAIEVLLQKVEDDPMLLPERPPYPDH